MDRNQSCEFARHRFSIGKSWPNEECETSKQKLRRCAESIQSLDGPCKYAITRSGLGHRGPDDHGQLLILFENPRTIGEVRNHLLGTNGEFPDANFQHARIAFNCSSILAYLLLSGWVVAIE